MAQHFYSSIATLSSLAAPAAQADITLLVPQASFIGYPASYPYTIRIEGGTANEELVDVTGAPVVSGANYALPVSRGIDGSGARTHAAGSVVDHPITGRDLTEAAAHIYASQAVHGLAAGDAVAGLVELANHAALNGNVHGASASEFLTRSDVTMSFHRGSATVTTAADGTVTISHGAPFTPAHVIPYARFTGGFAGSIVGSDSITATTFRTRVSGATTVQTNVPIGWLAIGA